MAGGLDCKAPAICCQGLAVAKWPRGELELRQAMAGNLQNWNKTQKEQTRQKELVLITQHRLAGGSNTLWDILEILQHPAQLGCGSQRTSSCSHAGKAAHSVQLDAHQAPVAPQLRACSATKAKNQLCGWIRDTRTPLSPSQSPKAAADPTPNPSKCWDCLVLGGVLVLRELPKPRGPSQEPKYS